VLELLGCDLLEYLRESSEQLLLIESLILIRDILRAVSTVHSKGYVHGDIKPENFAFTTIETLDGVMVDKDDVNVKLLDFDNSRLASDRTKSDRATPPFLAPEACRELILTRETDMWAVGVVCYLLLSGNALIEPQASLEDVNRIFEDSTFPAAALEKLSGRIPDDLLDLLSRLLSRDPQERPTAEDALKIVLNLLS
jgi:serine/threonine protein kinase